METLRAASLRKEVAFKIAYGMTLDTMLEWGLYISEPRCCVRPPLQLENSKADPLAGAALLSRQSQRNLSMTSQSVATGCGTGKRPSLL